MQPGQEDPQKTPPGYSEPVDPYESAEFDPTGDSPYHPPFPAHPGPATPPEQQQSGPPAPPSYPASYPPQATPPYSQQATPPPYSQQGTPPPYSPQGTPPPYSQQGTPSPSYPTPPAPDPQPYLGSGGPAYPQPYPGSGGPAYPQQQTSGGPVYPPPQPYVAPQPQYPAPQPYAPQQQPFGAAQPYPMQQQGYPTPPPYGYEPGRPVGPQNTVGLVSMILAICSAALFCCTWIGLPLSAAAVVTGIIGLNKAKAGVATNRGQALTGLIVGSIATAWFILALILGAVNILSPQTFS